MEFGQGLGLHKLVQVALPSPHNFWPTPLTSVCIVAFGQISVSI